MRLAVNLRMWVPGADPGWDEILLPFCAELNRGRGAEPLLLFCNGAGEARLRDSVELGIVVVLPHPQSGATLADAVFSAGVEAVIHPFGSVDPPHLDGVNVVLAPPGIDAEWGYRFPHLPGTPRLQPPEPGLHNADLMLALDEGGMRWAERHGAAARLIPGGEAARETSSGLARLAEARDRLTDPLPLVSIVTPSFKQGQFIERTLLSVLEQDYPHIEYLVLDGGSTDETAEILQRYAGRIRWISRPDNGQTDAIKQGMQAARGEILAYLNSDDTYQPGAVRRAVAHFLAHPECDLLYGQGRYIDAEDRCTGMFPTRSFKYSSLDSHCFLSQPSAFWRRRLYRKAGPFDDTLHYVMDYEFWMRAGRVARITMLPEPLANARMGEWTKTTGSNDKLMREAIDVATRNFGYISQNWLSGLQLLKLPSHSIVDRLALSWRSRALFHELENSGLKTTQPEGIPLLAPMSRLGMGSNEDDYLAEGWYEPERVNATFRRWTGPRARFFLGGSRGRLVLDTMDLRGRRNWKLKTTLEISIDGAPAAVESWLTTGHRYISAAWPDDERMHEVVLRVNPAWIPATLTPVSDCRSLGLLIGGIFIERPSAVPAQTPPRLLNFSPGEEPFRGTGWYDVEPSPEGGHQCWTGPMAEAWLSGGGSGLVVDCHDLRPRRLFSTPTIVTTLIDDVEVDQTSLTQPGQRYLRIPWPQDPRPHRVTLRVNRTWHPFRLLGPPDPRDLGLLCRRMFIIPDPLSVLPTLQGIDLSETREDNFWRGWHAVERDAEGNPFRWISRAASVDLSGANRSLRIDYADLRPRAENGRPGVLKAFVDGQSAGESLTEFPGEAMLELPWPGDDQPHTLELQADPVWTPSQAGDSADARELGVLIRRIAASPGP